MCNLILCTTLSPPRALLSVRESRIIVINVEKYLSPKVCLAKKKSLYLFDCNCNRKGLFSLISLFLPLRTTRKYYC